jgi:peptidoglycan/LPS O-acetylase OafA/YrhL
MAPVNAGTAYRPDVDGLRAIAVLSVIAFHLDKALVPGGFVGVDVFFVISGFLISRNIIHEIDEDRFSLAEFYRRRVKRIAPAMLLVVAVTLGLAQLLMLPEDARETSKSAFWSLASLANVYFWLSTDTSYFAADNHQLPLLHLWSLGVEEQFYLLWPLALLLFYRARRAALFAAVIGVIAVGSFALAEALVRPYPAFAYYMLPTRTGELMLGALVAIAALRGVERRVPAAWIAPAAVVGFLSLLGSIFLLSENVPFPGWYSVLPTASTALLILAGHCGSTRVSRLLGWKPLVGIGLISYSAYLWHWPILALHRYGYGTVAPASAPVFLAVTLILAWASYRFVETPLRRSTAPFWRVIARQYVLPAGALAAVSLVTIYPQQFGVSLESTAYRSRLAELRAEAPSTLLFDQVCQRQRITPKDLTDPRCILGADTADPPRAILWGDSHASHFIGMLEVFGREAGFRFRNVEAGTCPPLDADPEPFLEIKRIADCRASLEIVRPAIHESSVVIIAATWSYYQRRSSAFLDTFFDTARALAGDGKLVVLIGRVPMIPGYDRRCREKALSYPWLECPESTSRITASVASVNERLRRFAEQTPNVRYFEVTPYLCPDSVCRAFARDGRPKYFDEGHLTYAASSRLGVEIVANEGVPAPFRLIADWPAARAHAVAGK